MSNDDADLPPRSNGSGLEDSDAEIVDNNRPTLPVVPSTDRSNLPVIRSVEQNLANANPRDAAKWTRIRGDLKRQDIEARLARYAEIEAAVKIATPIVSFVAGLYCLVVGGAALHGVGIVLIGFTIAAYGGPKAVESLIAAITRFFGGGSNGF